VPWQLFEYGGDARGAGLTLGLTAKALSSYQTWGDRVMTGPVNSPDAAFATYKALALISLPWILAEPDADPFSVLCGSTSPGFVRTHIQGVRRSSRSTRPDHKDSWRETDVCRQRLPLALLYILTKKELPLYYLSVG
jgi:hypothetical protein